MRLDGRNHITSVESVWPVLHPELKAHVLSTIGSPMIKDVNSAQTRYWVFLKVGHCFPFHFYIWGATM